MTSVGTLGSAQVSSEISQVEARLNAPITSLNDQITGDKADISAWAAISGAISTLSKSLSGIDDASSTNNLNVSSTATTVATATAASSAETGTFTLDNVTLAKPQEIFSALQGSGAAQLSGGTGSLTFTLKSGKTETVSVGSGSLTLNGVAAAINKAAGGVQASVIGTSTGARLVFQSSSTGSSQAFSVAGTGALAKFSFASGSGGTTESIPQKAADASVTLNGVPITSTTNSISSAVSGLTISLVGSGNTTISVASTPDNLSAAVSTVANNLNAALSTIAKETKFVKPGSGGSASGSAKSGVLLGNFTATNLANQLLTAVSGVSASGLSANAIGLTVSNAGAVSFNSTAFAAAFAQNPTAVQALVGQIHQTLSNISASAIGGSGSSKNASGTTEKATGTIGVQTTSLQGTITSIDAQITQITKENDAQISLLLNEFTIAENASTAASITQSFLSVFNNSSGSSSG
jgi:flagellar hook-associated protein 2